MTDERDFVITRVLDAPRALVFRAWTDPAQLARWWGPSGFTTPVSEVDLRPGGAWRIVMRSPDGVDYPLRGVYREIVEPERLVYTVNLQEHPTEWREQIERDAGGEVTHESVDTVTFEVQDGRTLVTVRSRFTSRAVRDAMVKMGMHEGWSETLDRLAELVAQP